MGQARGSSPPLLTGLVALVVVFTLIGQWQQTLLQSLPANAPGGSTTEPLGAAADAAADAGPAGALQQSLLAAVWPAAELRGENFCAHRAPKGSANLYTMAKPIMDLQDFSVSLWFSGTGPSMCNEHRSNPREHWFDGCLLVGTNLGETPSCQWGKATQRKKRLIGPRNDFGLSVSSEGVLFFGVGARYPYGPKADYLRYDEPDKNWTAAPVSYGGESTLRTRGGYNDGKWHHVVATRVMATASLSLVVDGEEFRCDGGAADAAGQQATGAGATCTGAARNTRPLDDTSHVLRVGSEVNACIGAARIHDTALSLGEARALQDGTRPARPAALPVYYGAAAVEDAQAFPVSGLAGALELHKVQRTEAGTAVPAAAVASVALREVGGGATAAVVVVADADVRFAEPAAAALRALLGARDVVFERDEHVGAADRPSTGLMAMAANARTAALWSLLSAEPATGLAAALDKTDVRWGLLPPEFVSRGAMEAGGASPIRRDVGAVLAYHHSGAREELEAFADESSRSSGSAAGACPLACGADLV